MSDYSDILSRKTFRDRFSEGLNKQADSIGKPMNKGQAATQNILRGFAAGFSNDREREAKLAELEEQYKQMDAFERELKMSVGKSQKIKADNENFFLTYQNDYGVLDKLLEQGKTKEADFVLRDLFGKFNELNPDRKLGTYLGFDDTTGNIFVHDNNGNAKSMHYSDLTAQTIPQDRHGDYPNLLTRNSKFIINNKMKMLALDEEKSRVSIDQAKAQIANLNAHGKLYEAQGKEALRKAENPYMSDMQKLDYKSDLDQKGELQKSRLKVNNDYLEGLSKENTKASNILPILDEFSNLITTTTDLFGSSKWKEAKRALAKFTGDDAPIQRANYLQKYFFPEIKGIAGNPNQREWGDLVGKIISESQNVEAALAQITLDKKILQGKQREFKNLSKVLSGTDHKYYYYDPEITSRMKRLEKQGVLIKLKAPDGSINEVPVEELEFWKNKGAEVINE